MNKKSRAAILSDHGTHPLYSEQRKRRKNLSKEPDPEMHDCLLYRISENDDGEISQKLSPVEKVLARLGSLFDGGGTFDHNPLIRPLHVHLFV